ncbi:MAG: hypothetical protein KUL86_14075 [Castellaniella sp.]|nr:hypothetical protein [Castellaniella sp.]
MAQFDPQITTVAPLPGLQLVQDTNKALESVVTDFSGSTPPAKNVFPYSLWADTATGAIKRRNAANTAWVIEGRLLRAHAPMATFAEIDALIADEGPIIVTDMACTAPWIWTTSAYFTGYRNPLCATIPQHFAATPRAWELAVTGGVWSESDPKQKRVIAWFREQGLTVASASWAKGWGRIADLGSGNWKAPDLQDVFLRMAGTDADTANAAGAGIFKADTLKSHYHEAAIRYATADLTTQASPNRYAANGSTLSGSTGTAETAPVHTRVAPAILI